MVIVLRACVSMKTSNKAPTIVLTFLYFLISKLLHVIHVQSVVHVILHHNIYFTVRMFNIQVRQVLMPFLMSLGLSVLLES